MKQLVISCSLSPASHSAQMAERLVTLLGEHGDEVEFIDLRDLPLPFCDAGVCYKDANAAMVTSKIEQADAVALAVPIYNYDVGGAARNLVALTGSAWNDQIVGLICAAGGQRSYMSIMPLANSLMLDFRCVIIPRYVYASRPSFPNGRLDDPTVEDRLSRLAYDLHHFAVGLRPPKNHPST